MSRFKNQNLGAAIFGLSLVAYLASCSPVHDTFSADGPGGDRSDGPAPIEAVTNPGGPDDSGATIFDAKPVPLDFALIMEAIIKPKCLTCHSKAKAMDKAEGIVFESYSDFFAVPYGFDSIPVVAGNPLKSSLYIQTRDKEMPRGKRPKLSKDEIQMIETWIRNGAPERVTEDDLLLRASSVQ